MNLGAVVNHLLLHCHILREFAAILYSNRCSNPHLVCPSAFVRSIVVSQRHSATFDRISFPLSFLLLPHSPMKPFMKCRSADLCLTPILDGPERSYDADITIAAHAVMRREPLFLSLASNS